MVAEDCEIEQIQRLEIDRRIQPVPLTVDFDSGFVNCDPRRLTPTPAEGPSQSLCGHSTDSPRLLSTSVRPFLAAVTTPKGAITAVSSPPET